MNTVKNWLLSLVLLTIIWVASSWALFRPGFFRVHDFVHAARVAELVRAASDGQIPVRWSANFGTGYGMPLFEFYAPLPYYVGGWFWWLGVPMIVVLKILWGGCSLLTMLGAYFLGKRWYGQAGGVVTAAALTLAPYRAVNLFVRGALSEAWGIMAIPWVLLGIVKIVKGDRYGWFITALGVAALCLSHNLMTILCLPLAMLFAGGLILIERPPQWLAMVLRVGISVGLGLGLAAFYIVPAYVEKDFTKVAQIVGGYFDYRLHFLYVRQFIKPFWGYGGSTWGPDDGISFFLGWGQLAGLVLSLMLATRWWELRTSVKKHFWQTSLLEYGLLGCLTGAALFMTLGRSVWLWDLVPQLQFVQFPWRWLGPAVVFISLLIGTPFGWLKGQARRWGLAIILVLVTVVSNTWYFQPESQLADPSGLYTVDPSEIQNHLSQVLNDYVPKQMPGVLDIQPPTAVAMLGTQPVVAAAVKVDRSQEKLVSVSPTQPTLLTWSIADFPGWQVAIDGQPATKSVAPPGLVAVQVPSGEHLVSAQLTDTPIRSVADVMSVVTVGAVVSLVYIQAKYL